MESKLACTLILALAILIGFSFVGFSEAKASQVSRADSLVAFGPAACCDPDFNKATFNGSQFTEKNRNWISFKVFAFTEGKFQRAALRALRGNFNQYLDVAADRFDASLFKADFEVSSAKGANFDAGFVTTSGFTRAVQSGDFSEFVAFTPSNLRNKDFFEDRTFDHGFASTGCCKSVGFDGSFERFGSQFRV